MWFPVVGGRRVRLGIDSPSTMLAARQTAAPRNKNPQVVVGFAGGAGVADGADGAGVAGVAGFCTLRAAYDE